MISIMLTASIVILARSEQQSIRTGEEMNGAIIFSLMSSTLLFILTMYVILTEANVALGTILHSCNEISDVAVKRENLILASPLMDAPNSTLFKMKL